MCIRDSDTGAPGVGHEPIGKRTLAAAGLHEAREAENSEDGDESADEPRQWAKLVEEKARGIEKGTSYKSDRTDQHVHVLFHTRVIITRHWQLLPPACPVF